MGLVWRTWKVSVCLKYPDSEGYIAIKQLTAAKTHQRFKSPPGHQWKIIPCFLRSSPSILCLSLSISSSPHLPSSADRVSDFSLTNSLATSSLERWERIRMAVRPVSSMWMRCPSGHQQAQLPFSMMSLNCITVKPTTRSARPKQ